MRTTTTAFTAILAVLCLLLAPIAQGELVINKHSVDFTAHSPYNEQIKVCAGEIKTDLITIRNTGEFPSDYVVEVRSDYPGVIRAPTERFDLAPGREQEFPISIEQTAGVAGTFAYEVTIADRYGRIERLQRTIRVDQCETTVLEVSPSERELGLCEPTSVRVTVRNIGSYRQNYALRFGPYEGIVQADSEFLLDAGKSRSQDVNLTFACDDYGARTLPIDVFGDRGVLVAQGEIRFDVRNEYDIALDVPTSMVVCADASTVVPILVRNLAPVRDEIAAQLDAPAFASFDGGQDAVNLAINAGEDDKLLIAFTPDKNDIGEHRIGLTASDRFGGVNKEREIVLTVENCYDPSIELRTRAGTCADGKVVSCCGEETYFVNVRNDGTREQAFALAVDGPAFLELEETTVRVAPGQNADVELRADLPCTDETYDATVTVSPVGQPQVVRTTQLRIESQTQRTCHLIAIDDDELVVREGAQSVPVIVKHLGIQGGTYDIDLDNDLFGVDEEAITLAPGQQKVIHLTPKADLAAQPKGRYVLQPSFALDGADALYEEHVGIDLRGKAPWDRFKAWLVGLPLCGAGVCGWGAFALAFALLAALIALVFVYAGKLAVFPDGLPRRALAVAKTAIVLLIAVALIALVVMGPPAAASTHEGVAQDGEPTVIEWYEGTEMSVDLDAYFADPDMDILSYAATQPADITARIVGSTLTLVPDEGFTGENELVVTANDAQGGVAESPEFLLRVIPRKELSFAEWLRVWCSRVNLVLALAILVVLLLIAIGVKERRENGPRDNVLVVVPRSARKKVAKKATRRTAKALKPAQRVVRVTGEAGYIAAKDGTTVHAPDCMVARRIPKGKRVAFSTKGAAVKAKLVPCRVCRPFR